ncbi:HD domain-containing protein [Candidatus Wolfebacteria bacterium]|nr:HD domain-containing protein [Candidatus Wolfebacteria bacterium]
MDTEKIVNFFFEVASLRRLLRSHQQLIAQTSDNILDHSFRVAIVAFVLGKLEGVNHTRAMKIGLFHDLAEARTGDANAINKQYLDIKESEAHEDQARGLPIAQEFLSILHEYEARETPESAVAKDADLLDQMVLQQEYFYRDPKRENHRIWQNYAEAGLTTESAKALGRTIREANPFEWLYQDLEKKSGARIDR